MTVNTDNSHEVLCDFEEEDDDESCEIDETDSTNGNEKTVKT